MKQKIEGGWADRIRELMSVKSKYATPMLDLVKEKGKCPFCNFVVKYPEFAGANRGVVKHITKTHKEVKGRVDLIIDVISDLLASERQRCVDIVKQKNHRWHIRFENTSDPEVNYERKKFNDEVSELINSVVEDIDREISSQT